MIFNLLTFLAALSTAGVAEWFSIVGIISIYAGAPYHAGLVLGVVLGFAKLITTSWLYRNWKEASWKLKTPLIYFLLALMMATSMGVFGFLTKSHLEQGAATIDNSAKVERLDQQITREKSIIADDEKIIAQLDASINSYIGKDRTDKAVAIRKSQAPQRKQLRDDIDASQKKIDNYSEDKLKLTSEVRALSLEVGPIRYIAELFYGTDGDQTAKIESAVKMFTLLIVSTLDPLAIILLIAANHTLLRRQNEKKEKAEKDTESAGRVFIPVAPQDGPRQTEEGSQAPSDPGQTRQDNEQLGGSEIYEGQNSEVDAESIAPSIGEVGAINEEEKVDSIPAGEISEVLANDTHLHEDDESPSPFTPVQPVDPARPEDEPTVQDEIPLNEEEEAPKTFYWPAVVQAAPAIIRSPGVSRVEKDPAKNTFADKDEAPEVEEISSPKKSIIEDAVLRELELRGHSPHFIPQKINEETKQTTPTSKSAIAKAVQEVESSRSEEVKTSDDTEVTVLNGIDIPAQTDKYPVRLSWLKEFKGN